MEIGPRALNNPRRSERRTLPGVGGQRGGIRGALSCWALAAECSRQRGSATGGRPFQETTPANRRFCHRLPPSIISFRRARLRHPSRSIRFFPEVRARDKWPSQELRVPDLRSYHKPLVAIRRRDAVVIFRQHCIRAVRNTVPAKISGKQPGRHHFQVAVSRLPSACRRSEFPLGH